jgi:5-methylcytosine-specific restriction endonuclease McrA
MPLVCGIVTASTKNVVQRSLRRALLARRAAKRRDRYRCTRCGHKPPPRSHPKYKRLRKTDRLEVNHIRQARGAHRALSCLHHLENLETLCLACHQAETRRQRA